MLDIFNIPSNTDTTKIFYTQGSTTWQTWQKPRNAKFIQILCVGSGGGGAGGAANAAASSANGGGGGAGAGVTRTFLPAFLLPDTLYIQVAVGGAGGAGSPTGTATAGSAGGISYVAISPATTAVGIIIQSNNATTLPGGGQISGAGGTGPSIWALTTHPFTTLGVNTITNGVGGFNGNSTQAINPLLVTGGVNGAIKPVNSQSAGSSILSASVLIPQTIQGGAAGGGDGSNGVGSLMPFYGTGGTGGGSSATALGGTGGNGWFGSGGGGGGGGLSTAFGGLGGGKGGNGGNGIVIITTIT